MPPDEPATAECWFLDVGQGTSNVILLGGGRGIVIDCGPRSTNVPLTLLKRYVHTIEVMILSHNDEDHDGGATRIIQAYPKAIKQVFFLADRPAKFLKAFTLLRRERVAGNLLSEPQRLEANERPQSLYSEPDGSIDLRLLYPTFMEAQAAETLGGRRPNATSAILALLCGSRSVIFSGDATSEAWDAIGKRLAGRLPLSCDLLTIPHHGGHLTAPTMGETNNQHDTRDQTVANHIYSQIVRPRLAVVSVGSSNRFRDTFHPLPGTISVLSNLGIETLCTQMTPRCCDDLEAIRPGLLPPLSPSRSTGEVRRTNAGRSKDVACMSSIVAEISPDRVTISRCSEHRQAVSAAVAAGSIRPLCR
jgi:beta-lactamase superfamily II metal-dependent hydrolase